VTGLKKIQNIKILKRLLEEIKIDFMPPIMLELETILLNGLAIASSSRY